VRQSGRGALYRQAVERLLESADAYREDGTIRFAQERRPTLLRADGTATYHLASVVDDVELRITDVIRGSDHLPNTPLHEELARALGAEPPRYLHHGLILGPDGAKLSKRHGAASLADLRADGIPAEAVRAYLDELGLPRHDVHLPGSSGSRSGVARMPGEELCARIGAPARLAPARRGARTLAEAHDYAALVLGTPDPAQPDERGSLTLARFAQLREGMPAELDEAAARTLVRELKAVGGDLRSLRRALTGAERGPELWAVVAALERAEALGRVRASLAAGS
jgi:glutamyl/glutaminyl-tRNA synthetase